MEELQECHFSGLIHDLTVHIDENFKNIILRFVKYVVILSCPAILYLFSYYLVHIIFIIKLSFKFLLSLVTQLA